MASKENEWKFFAFVVAEPNWYPKLYGILKLLCLSVLCADS